MMSKKISFSVLSAILALAIYPVGVLAQIQDYGPSLTIEDLIPSLEWLAWVIFCGIVVICFIVAGVMFLTAQGDAEKLKTARSAFIWGVAGVVVGILAYSIMEIVKAFLL